VHAFHFPRAPCPPQGYAVGNGCTDTEIDGKWHLASRKRLQENNACNARWVWGKAWAFVAKAKFKNCKWP